MAADPSIVERYPEIPLPRIRALGNVLRHEYGEIDPSVIWDAFERDQLALLVAAARRELDRLDG